MQILSLSHPRPALGVEKNIVLTSHSQKLRCMPISKNHWCRDWVYYKDNGLGATQQLESFLPGKQRCQQLDDRAKFQLWWDFKWKRQLVALHKFENCASKSHYLTPGGGSSQLQFKRGLWNNANGTFLTCLTKIKYECLGHYKLFHKLVCSYS